MRLALLQFLQHFLKHTCSDALVSNILNIRSYKLCHGLHEIDSHFVILEVIELQHNFKDVLRNKLLFVWDRRTLRNVENDSG